MGCFRYHVENTRKNREETTVLRHLISKAEKRKQVAENFHVYALLQSTIHRLKLDDHLVKMRNLTINNKRFKVNSSRLLTSDDVVTKRLSDVEISVSDNLTFSDGCIDKDPLDLDIFFQKLKES
ncbi:hypothetical protein ACF0H5_003443 [Mactra antiquata]